MTRIAELADRLQRLAKRREDEGIYTDAALCDEVATYLRTTGEEAGGVKVKALEWVLEDERDPEFPRWHADGLGKHYSVFKTWWGTKDKWGYFFEGFHDTSKEAKAAAQADYERRILSAIEPTPSPIVDDAMVEKPRFVFERYVNGQLMAEGVQVERASTVEEATLIAARIASKGPNGESPVLVLNAALSGAREGWE